MKRLFSIIFLVFLSLLFLIVLSLAECKKSTEITVVATAYTWTGNPTATGHYPARGSVVVDPAVIPLGSIIHVPGYGYGVAMDTGRAIKGNKIDIYYNTREEALSWGVREIKVKIIEVK